MSLKADVVDFDIGFKEYFGTAFMSLALLGPLYSVGIIYIEGRNLKERIRASLLVFGKCS